VRLVRKEKKVVLKSQFHISTPELYKAVVKAELDIKNRAKKKVKTKSESRLYEVENKKDIEEEARNKSKSEIEDCIVVDVE
jgi:4-diphosphocytidyl-2C-methyl-D-erythritol kinase